MPCPIDMPDALCALIPRLTRLGRHLTGNPDLAQDLVQDVLLKLWTRLQEGHDIDNLPAYAATAMRNEYRQYLRNSVTRADLEEADDAIAPTVFATLAVHELEAAIDTLPQPQARLMRLVAAGETSPRSLAQLTGSPEGTVMSRLARARSKLRAHVGLGARATTAELF